MRRLATDHAAEGDDAGKAARLRERHRAERQLERARHLHDRDRLTGHARELELVQRALEQPVGHLAVEAADDDTDRAAGPVGGAGEDAVAVRNRELPGRVSRWSQPRQLVLLGRWLVRGRRVAVTLGLGIVFLLLELL